MKLHRFLLSFPGNREFRKRIKKDFGFYPKNSDLFRYAFIHRSVVSDPLKNNERLEFLGDAVLGLIISDFLIIAYPNLEEGRLSKIRSKLINRTQLNQLALKTGVSKYIEFDKSILFDKHHLNDLFGNALEAFIGAVFLDKGYKFTKKYVLNHIIDTHIDMDELIRKEDNFKGRLYEYVQKENQKIKFVTVESRFNEAKAYQTQVYINDQEMGIGIGRKKKIAEQQASEMALKKLNIL